MSRALVDPELQAILDVFPPLEIGPETIPVLRAAFAEQLTPEADYGRPDVTIKRRTIPGPSGAPDVPVIVYGLQPPLRHSLR